MGHWGAEEAGASSGVVPLATPLLVGPGAITTTIVFIRQYGVWITLASVLLTFAIIAIIYRFIGLLYRILRQSGSDVVAKIMGMLLAAIAVQFIREGIQASFFTR
jgi:multiple antibiotic resistance protein